MKGAATALVLAVLALAVPGETRAAPSAGSELALPLVGGDEIPMLIFAQRAIERSWGPSEDSVYVEVDVPQWRSEGLAIGLSAAVPGAGQLYAGDRRGLWFMLAEAVGWTARLFYRHRGEEFRDQAAGFAGQPGDSSAAWSFERWAAATQDDPAELQRLYAADREAFYDRIADEPRYLAGWEAAQSRDHFSSMRETSDARLRSARYASIVLWVNHAVSAVEALRAARLHNMRLAPHLGLKVKSGWRGGAPSLMAVVERKF